MVGKAGQVVMHSCTMAWVQHGLQLDSSRAGWQHRIRAAKMCMNLRRPPPYHKVQLGRRNAILAQPRHVCNDSIRRN